MATLSSIRKKYGASKRRLYVDEIAKEEIERVIKHAEENIVSGATLESMAAGLIKPVGDDRRHVCRLSRGFRVVYSIENQAIGLCRHLSISLGDTRSLPSLAVMNELMERFGFDGEVEDCYVWVEELRTTLAINLFQPLKWDRKTSTLT
jgi:hypothetical protein